MLFIKTTAPLGKVVIAEVTDAGGCSLSQDEFPGGYTLCVGSGCSTNNWVPVASKANEVKCVASTMVQYVDARVIKTLQKTGGAVDGGSNITSAVGMSEAELSRVAANGTLDDLCMRPSQELVLLSISAGDNEDGWAWHVATINGTITSIRHHGRGLRDPLPDGTYNTLDTVAAWCVARGRYEFVAMLAKAPESFAPRYTITNSLGCRVSSAAFYNEGEYRVVFDVTRIGDNANTTECTGSEAIQTVLGPYEAEEGDRCVPGYESFELSALVTAGHNRMAYRLVREGGAHTLVGGVLNGTDVLEAKPVCMATGTTYNVLLRDDTHCEPACPPEMQVDRSKWEGGGVLVRGTGAVCGSDTRAVMSSPQGMYGGYRELVKPIEVTAAPDECSAPYFTDIPKCPFDDNQIVECNVADVASYGNCSTICQYDGCSERMFELAGAAVTGFGCCTPPPRKGTFPFLAGNGEPYQVSQAKPEPRERYLGMRNRVMVGLMVHQTRKAKVNCVRSLSSDSKGGSSNRTKGVNATAGGELMEKPSLCRAGYTVSNPYGADPAFLKASEKLYQPDLEGEKKCCQKSAFNSTCLPPTCGSFYSNATETGEAELNENGVPYGFRHKALSGYPKGYPVLFDIDFSAKRMEEVVSYMKDGFFLDDFTESVSANLVTYNADLDTYSFMKMGFTLKDTGIITFETEVNMIRADYYTTYMDFVRAGIEGIFVIFSFYQIIEEFHEIYIARKRTGSVFAYFRSMWNFADVVSLMCNVAGMLLWGYFILNVMELKLKLSYKVYASFTTQANFLQTHQLDQMPTAVDDMNHLWDTMTVFQQYTAVSTLNVILMVVRVLKYCDFQPRLGLITHTFNRAGSDLGHIAILVIIITVFYSVLVHLSFGRERIQYATPINSMLTMINLLTYGDTTALEAVNDYKEFPFQGLSQLVAVIASWSIGILFIILLMNFLLAIIVDAFSDVRSGSDENSVLNDLRSLLIGLASKSRHDKYIVRKLAALSKATGNYEDEEDKEEDEREGDDLKKKAKNYVRLGNEMLDEKTLIAFLSSAHRQATTALKLKHIAEQEAMEQQIIEDGLLRSYSIKEVETTDKEARKLERSDHSGAAEPQLREAPQNRFGSVVRRNPKHGVRLPRLEAIEVFAKHAYNVLPRHSELDAEQFKEQTKSDVHNVDLLERIEKLERLQLQHVEQIERTVSGVMERLDSVTVPPANAPKREELPSLAAHTLPKGGFHHKFH